MSGLAFVRQIESDRHGHKVAIYRCECGNEKAILMCSVNRGATRSCGCLKKRLHIERYTKHGMSHSSEYGIWCNMISRCGNKNVPAFENYGARGISVCQEWLSSFDAFYADMGPRPSLKHSLERADNDAGYTPNNVSWQLPIVQANNRTDNRFVEFNGKRATVSQWAREIGISSSLLHARLTRLGWTVEESLTTPLRPLTRVNRGAKLVSP